MAVHMRNVIVRPDSADGNPLIRCLVALLINLVLIYNLAAVSAYNVDTNYPMLYPNEMTNGNIYRNTNFARSYFGYSVLLYRDPKYNSTWLVIGAPRGNYVHPTNNKLRDLIEPGVVYWCHISGECTQIEPSIAENERITIVSYHLNGRIMKDRSWFGAAISIEKSSNYLTICAPRTIMAITTYNDNEVFTMHGMCYSSDIFKNPKVEAERSYIEDYDFSKQWWYDPLYGFSVSYAPPQNGNVINRIIGAPNHDITGSVTMMRFTKSDFRETYTETTDFPIYDTTSRFGYSTTAGYYFNRTQLLYVSGDPALNHMGQVAILEPEGKPSTIANISGSSTGEYFGASLASGDLNQDGLDDLVVGAPHWKNDNGRVYIYLGTRRGKFDASTILEGDKEDALFGYAVACGDLDKDGFSDIIVGAPWEESGAIYIYNGDANLKDSVKLIPSQRITMQLPTYTIPEKLNIRTFGFSIAEPVDIDDNGYADIAVGAYKSGHAVILRSRPVVKTSLTIHTVPDTLQRNVRKFLVHVCVQYSGYDMARMQAFEISLTVDESHKRTEKTLFKLPSANILRDNCVNTSVTLSKNIQDFIEPITIYALHNFTHKDSRQSSFCPTCPVERKSDASKGAQALLSFDIGCGADRVCNSNISSIVTFLGIRNDSWVIGSNDITLRAFLMNHAEPAYLTTITFTLPHGIVLRSILPSCQEDMAGDNLTVTCNAGNPLGKDELKIVKLDLDMRHLTDGSLHGRVLEFTTEIQTRSVNHGTRTIKSSLTLQSEAFLSLNGKANEESYYLPDLDKEQLNVSFQHTYLILKSGMTPIKEARLLVNIPTSVNGSGSLVFLHKPRIYIAGGYRDCSSHGIDVIDAQQNEFQNEIVSDISEMNVPIFNNGTLPTIVPVIEQLVPNVSHQLLKRDLSSYTSVAARLTQALYTARMTNATGNLTRQDVVHLNCSTPSVNCSIVYCDLSELKTQQDVGKLMVKLILNATRFKDTIGLSDETKIVKFGTEAHVEIVQPANRIVSAEDTRRDMNLTTEFHSTAKTQELQLWVVLVSISLGLVLLCIIVILLCITGFFRRTMKEELTALKENEMTESVNKSEVTDNSE